MESNLDRLADSFDWSSVHFGLCFVGTFLCIYVMQLFSTHALGVQGECIISQSIRRSALWLLALSMCWAMLYSANKGWQPWPPDVLIVGAVDLFLLSPIVIDIRRKQTMRRNQAIG